MFGFRVFVGLAATVGLIVVGAGAASAQTHDHYKCYKVKDQKTFESAAADLTAIQSQFGVESCEIKPKAKVFCVPVEKTVTNIDPPESTIMVVNGEELGFNRLCYKVKCPKTDIGSHEVSDQFGTRTAEKFKVSTICTPAIDGPVGP